MKKVTLTAGVLSLFMMSSFLVLPLSSFAAKKVNVVGKEKIVLQGTATPQPNGSLKVHVTATTKNVKKLKNTDIALKIGATTKVTQGGKKIKVPAIVPGTKVKVWAIYDKRNQSVSNVNWVKVVK